MKKCKLIIVAICVVLLGVGAVTAYALEGAPIFSIKNELTELQLQELKEIEDKGAEMVGSFIYQEKVIKGEADPAMTRMSLQEVENILAQSNCFEDVLSSLESRQTYPDFAGGSGVSIREYWLDATGNEKILIIIEQAEVHYVNTNDTSLSTELLYG